MKRYCLNNGVLTQHPAGGLVELADMERGGRPCKVNGHQVYWEGTFHRFVERNGEPFAIFEHVGGEVSLVAPEQITFTDR